MTAEHRRVTAEQFCTWLSGHFDLQTRPAGLSADQVAVIREKLAAVAAPPACPRPAACPEAVVVPSPEVP